MHELTVVLHFFAFLIAGSLPVLAQLAIRKTQVTSRPTFEYVMDDNSVAGPAVFNTYLVLGIMSTC